MRSNLFSVKTVDVAHILVMGSITLFANYLSLLLLFFLREKEFIASYANSLATLVFLCFITPVLIEIGHFVSGRDVGTGYKNLKILRLTNVIEVYFR